MERRNSSINMGILDLEVEDEEWKKQLEIELLLHKLQVDMGAMFLLPWDFTCSPKLIKIWSSKSSFLFCLYILIITNYSLCQIIVVSYWLDTWIKK